jgi:hypothetical protein
MGYHGGMPAQIAHILAGEAALLEVAPSLAAAYGLPSNPLRKRRAADPGGTAGDWFRLGCQGPDLFYHNQRTKPLGIHYGSLAHRREYGSIVEGGLAWLSSLPVRGQAHGVEGGRPGGDEGLLAPAFAYLLGFASHAALDRALHPYIVWRSGWLIPGRPETEAYRGAHPFLERLLDLRLLLDLRGLEAREFDLEALLPLEGKDDGDEAGPLPFVVDLLMAGLAAAYPKATAEDALLRKRIENSLLDGRYFLRVTNPARTCTVSKDQYAYLDERMGPRSMSVVYPLALPEGLDVANGGHGSWRHPAGDGRESRQSVLDLALEGIKSAARALGAVLESREGGWKPGRLAREIGNGGLSVTDPGGKAVRPLACDPFPLLALMEAEYRRRLEAARRELH